MVKLDLMTGYKAERARSGDSSRGAWELIVVKENGRAKKEITIWVNNKPSGVTEGSMFRITRITSIKYGARRDSNNNWRDDVSVEADVEPMTYTDRSGGFEELDDMGDCPFTMDDDPFANSGSAFGGGEDPFADMDQLPL